MGVFPGGAGGKEPACQRRGHKREPPPSLPAFSFISVHFTYLGILVLGAHILRIDIPVWRNDLFIIL